MEMGSNAIKLEKNTGLRKWALMLFSWKKILGYASHFSERDMAMEDHVEFVLGWLMESCDQLYTGIST